MFLRAIFLLAFVGLSAMSREEKVGQLFMPFVMPELGQAHMNDAFELIEKHHVGGFLVKWGTPEQKLGAVKRLKGRSPRPLLFACDAEWGAAMNTRLVPRLPRQMTVAAAGDHHFMLKYGQLCGLQCRSMGMHLVFGPVVDVNTNPNNPIIGTRAFCDDPHHVKRCAEMELRGLKTAGMKTCIKHFPGHGDTSIDSHTDLPVVKKGMRKLRRQELLPFARLHQRTDAIMTAHIQLEAISKKPATMAPGVVNGILRGIYGFKGVVVTDALNMGAIAKLYTPEEAAVGALRAGCDLLLYGEHRVELIDDLLRETIPRAIRGVVESDISDEELDLHLERVERLKQDLCDERGDFNTFHNGEVELFNRSVFERAVALVRDPQQLVPLNSEFEVYHYRGGELPDDLADMADCMLASFVRPPTDEEIEAIEWCATDIPTLVVLYCSPYSVAKFSDRVGVIVAYEDHPEALRVVARGLQGKMKFIGTLPVKIASR